MTTFALIHGGGHDSWAWHLVIPELEKHGHRAVTVDLPTADHTATLQSNIDLAAEAFSNEPGPLVVVGHSMSGSVALGLEGRLDLEGIILLNSTVELSLEAAPDQPQPMLLLDWSELTIDELGVAHMGEEFCRNRFYADVPEELMPEVLAHVHPQTTSTATGPGALPKPGVPVVYVHAEDDRMINGEWAAWAAKAITGRPLRTIAGSHSSFYTRPAELAVLLEELAAELSAESARA